MDKTDFMKKNHKTEKVQVCLFLSVILLVFSTGCTIHAGDPTGSVSAPVSADSSLSDFSSLPDHSSLSAFSESGHPSSNPVSADESPSSGSEEPFQAYSGSYAASVNSATGYDDGLTGRNIFFTFDDGPSSVNTPQILATLEKYKVKATFFICGPDTQASRDLIKQEYDAGHTIGIHCYSHNLTNLYQSEASFFADFDRIEAMITAAIGVKPSVYRFPGGTNNDFISKPLCDAIRIRLKERGYTYYDWNVSAYDSNTPPAADIMAAVIDQCEKRIGAANPSIVLMHDSVSRTTTVEALEMILGKLILKGYHFASLDNTVKPVQFVKR